MPTLDDYDPNKDETQGGFGSNGSSGSSSGGGQLFGGASKQVEQQYTPWSRFTSANSDVANKLAGGLSDTATADAKTAQGDLASAQGAFDSGVNSNYQAATSRTPPAATSQTALPVQSGATPPPAFGTTAFGSKPINPAPTQATPTPALTPAKPAAPQSSWDALIAPGTTPAPNGLKGPGFRPPGASNITGTPRQLTRDAVLNGPKGPKDLEAAAGADAWGKLTNDTTKAGNEANALGTQSGVGALLQQNNALPTSAADQSFNAALVNGAGQQNFQGINNQYGGDKLANNATNANQASQDAWAGLTSDASAAKGRMDADAARVAFNAKPNAAEPSTQPATGPGSHADNEAAWKNSGGQAQYLDGGGHPISANGQGKGLPPNFDNSKDFGSALARYDAWVKAGRPNSQGPDGAKVWNTKTSTGQSVGQMFDGMTKGLDISGDQLSQDIAKMTPDEYNAFMSQGVVPTWMDMGPNATAKKGVPGGLQTFYASGTSGVPDTGPAGGNQDDGGTGPSSELNAAPLKAASGAFGPVGSGIWQGFTVGADALDKWNQDQYASSQQGQLAAKNARQPGESYADWQKRIHGGK